MMKNKISRLPTAPVFPALAARAAISRDPGLRAEYEAWKPFRPKTEEELEEIYQRTQALTQEVYAQLAAEQALTF
ncbi:MAG: hypothetical protein HC924_18860 [Synechococcaceae cyanobacterium SM2_3_2]|nr:hypothetical protein [Synechococcaceae cyanobacterium SM2_3_2]